MRRNKLLISLFVLCIFLGSVVLAGAQTKSVVINVWKAPWLKGIPGQPITDKSTTLDWYLQLSDAFSKSHPGVTVKWTEYGWSENRDKINAGILTGQLPDITYDSMDVLMKYYYQKVVEPV